MTYRNNSAYVAVCPEYRKGYLQIEASLFTGTGSITLHIPDIHAGLHISVHGVSEWVSEWVSKWESEWVSK